MFLVLTEKPDQAKEISHYLQNMNKKGSAFVGKFHNKDICVLPLQGHIMQIAKDLSEHSKDFKEKDWSVGFEKLPYYPPETMFYKREPSKMGFKKYNEAKKWIAECNKIIVATDPDIEGAALAYEVIVANRALDKVIDYIDMNNIILVEKLLQDALNGKKSHLDFLTMAYQGMIRGDFNYGVGINISRYLIVKTKAKSTFGTQQTRLLDEIVQRTIENLSFKKKKYYTVVLKTKYGDFTIEVNEEDKFNKEKMLQIANEVDNLKNIEILSVEKKEKEEKPLPWFDGSDVAQEASSILKVSPLELLDEKKGLLESLYLKKMMTYPRGEAKGKMPLSQLELQKEIVSSYQNLYGVKIDTDLVKKKLWYKDGEEKVNHTPYTIAKPSIDVNKLSKDERVVFDIVAKRLLSVFMPNPVNLHIKVKGKIGDYEVTLTEISDIKRGYKDVYNTPVKESKAKDITKGEDITIDKVVFKEDETKPRPLYTEKSIITLMRRKKIGTQATYSALIQTISSKERPYVNKLKNKLIGTKYAQAFLKILPKEAINILEEFEDEVIKKLETKEINLNQARNKRNELIQKTFDLIKNGLNDETIREIVNTLDNKQTGKNTIVGKCPKCSGNLIAKKNKYECENVKWAKTEDGKWVNKGKCDFSISKKIENDNIKVEINKKNLKELLKTNKTKVEVYYKKNKNKQKKDVILKDNKLEIIF